MSFFDKARRARLVKLFLDDKLPPEALRALSAEPQRLHTAPTRRLVTLMFIDIVGFSMAVEQSSPDEAFQRLTEILTRLKETVHRHGGTVDRALGDGLLCFFGYYFEEQNLPIDHADRALACAIEIQTTNLARNLEAARREEPVHPLRIGINTAEIYFANLGGDKRLEMSLLGHGVGYAKRLEAACEPDCIMMGATTYDFLHRPPGFGVKLMKRLIRIKGHHQEMIEAYECDPFLDRPVMRSEALAAYRRFTGAQRREMRWSVPPGLELRAMGDWGYGEVVNFSESGLLLRTDRYLGRQTDIAFYLDSADGELRLALFSLGLVPLICEVRWGRPGEGETFLLGVVIKNLGPELRKSLLTELRRHLGRGVPTARRA
jgi:class 3 adenylate cyclase